MISLFTLRGSSSTVILLILLFMAILRSTSVTAGTVSVSGDVFPNLIENFIVKGSRFITLTLSGDTFVNPLSDTNKARLVEGITSNVVASTTPFGFNSLWKPAQKGPNGLILISRNNDVVVNIVLVPVPLYQIVQDETISITIPPDCLQSGIPITATQQITVLHDLAVTIVGTFVASPTEVNVKGGGLLIQLVLSDNEFKPLLDNLKKITIISSLKTTAANPPSTGWNQKWIPAQTADAALTNIYLSDDKITCNILMVPVSSFEINLPEIVQLILPASATFFNRDIVASVPLTVKQTVLATLTGSFLDVNEPNGLGDKGLQNGGQSIVINLNDDIFVPVFTDVERFAIINGIVADSIRGDMPGGWNLYFTPLLKQNSATVVTRASDTTVTLDFPYNAKYEISRPEIITVNIPSNLITTAQTVVATPKFTVKTTTAVLGGSFITGDIGSLREKSVRNGGLQMEIVLQNDYWVTMTDDTRRAIISGFVGTTSPANGWNDVWIPTQQTVQGLGQVIVTNPTTLTLTMITCPSYAIAYFESIIVTIPSSALQNSKIPVVTTSVKPATSSDSGFRVANDPGSASLGGTFTIDTGANTEHAVRIGGRAIVVKLSNDHFTQLNNDFKNKFLEAMVAGSGLVGNSKDAKYGWAAWRDAVVASVTPTPSAGDKGTATPGLLAGFTMNGDLNELTITMIPVPSYKIVQPEVLSIEIPASCLTSNVAYLVTPKLVIYPGGDPDFPNLPVKIAVDLPFRLLKIGSLYRQQFVAAFESGLDSKLDIITSSTDRVSQKPITAHVYDIKEGFDRKDSSDIYFQLRFGNKLTDVTIILRLNLLITGNTLSALANTQISSGARFLYASGIRNSPSVMAFIIVMLTGWVMREWMIK